MNVSNVSNVSVDSTLVRDINKKIVLSAIRKKTSTRTELARFTELSYPTIGNIIKDLAAEGYVVDERLGKFGGGRKPMLVKFVPTARYIIGINLDGVTPQAVLADLNGTFVSQIVVGNSVDLEQDVSGSVIKLIEELWDIIQFPWERVIGIGLSVRGSFDRLHRHYFFPGRSDPISLQDDLESHFGVKVILERNANAAVLAERSGGQTIGARDIVFINIDQGVSSGLIIDGQLCRGFLGNAGEFGHVSVAGHSEICPDCGQKGCLETIVSIGGLVGAAQRDGLVLSTGNSVLNNYVELVSLARNGNPIVNQCFERAIDALALSIVSLVNIINPQLIVLGGRVVWHYPELLDAVGKIVLSSCWPYSRQKLHFALAIEEKYSFLHGAVSLILDQLFVQFTD